MTALASLIPGHQQLPFAPPAADPQHPPPAAERWVPAEGAPGPGERGRGHPAAGGRKGSRRALSLLDSRAAHRPKGELIKAIRILNSNIRVAHQR